MTRKETQKETSKATERAAGSASAKAQDGKPEIDIRHLTSLAKLRLTEAESLAVADDLVRIITMVDEMRAIDTDGVPPLAHPLDSHARLRPDSVSETVDRALYQRGAPSTEDGLYLVPRVIE